jgi:hypothetical protein
MTNNDWSAEETDDPRYADRLNFYKVEKWSRNPVTGHRLTNKMAVTSERTLKVGIVFPLP